MRNYDKGNVCFDTLTVVGREFFSSVNPLATCYWDYAFSVNCVMDRHPPKGKTKGIEHYVYDWTGHLNIGTDNKRIHLHNMDDDVGLVAQEGKLQLLHDTLKEFLKLYKDWGKVEKRKPVVVKHWLNPPESHYTGMVSYSITAHGSGTVSIGDCHNTIVFWLDAPLKQAITAKNTYVPKVVKQIEDLTKGTGKAVGAIQQLRKFFEREVFDVSEK